MAHGINNASQMGGGTSNGGNVRPVPHTPGGMSDRGTVLAPCLPSDTQGKSRAATIAGVWHSATHTAPQAPRGQGGVRGSMGTLAPPGMGSGAARHSPCVTAAEVSPPPL
jgi:hypothetical protein